MTLEDMRRLTQQHIGFKVITTGDVTGDNWYDERVNAAYRRLVTFQGRVPSTPRPTKRILRFFEFEQETDRSISIGTTNFITPAGTRVHMVMDVYDLTNARWLARRSTKEMRRLNPTEPGTPLRWVPGGKGGALGYFIHPIPTASDHEISVREYYYQYPDTLTTGQSPSIPDEWHIAIPYAAAAEAALLLDWSERHQEMEQKFLAFIAERKSPHEEASFSGGRRYFNIEV